MVTRAHFARAIAQLGLTHVDRAVAFLYFYSVTQAFEERSLQELAADLAEEAFPKPHIARLRRDLRQSRFTIRGSRKDTFRVDIRCLSELEDRFSQILKRRPIPQSDSVIPSSMVNGTRLYLERMVSQINACYDGNFFDACAVLCRRLMESLILEVYIRRGRHAEIQQDGIFLGLDRLIGIICADRGMALNRNTHRIMVDMKQVGDTAAHDRVYITQQRDIDDLKIRYRRMIDELLNLAGVRS